MTLNNPIPRVDNESAQKTRPFKFCCECGGPHETSTCLANQCKIPSLYEGQNVLRKLPATAEDRKNLPIATGVIDYFPLALGAVAELSKKANDQHNPGQPLHWSRGKSRDHADCLMRHFIERGTIDTDGISHTAKVAWRALAMLQEELEKEVGWNPK